MGRVQSKCCHEDSSTQCYGDDSAIRKTIRPIRISHLMAFNIRETNEQISGILSVEFDYYSYNDTIRYRDISYSDPRLLKHIEGNPFVMKNIDSYLRKNLLDFEYGLKF